MKHYTVRITDRALADMEEIYNYIAIQLQAPENAIGQYNRIAEAIEGLCVFLEKKDFYMIELPQNAAVTAFSGNLWCLVGV